MAEKAELERKVMLVSKPGMPRVPLVVSLQEEHKATGEGEEASMPHPGQPTGPRLRLLTGQLL